MVDWASGLDAAVVTLADDLTFVHQNGTDRDATFREAFPGLADRSAEKRICCHWRYCTVGFMRVFVVTLLMCMGCLGSAPSGHGKHIVFIAADQEYRSEESIPALAKILSARHAFKCTVLYSTNRRTGAIDPTVTDNVPGLEELRTADLLVIFARFLELPDEQMREIIDYTNSGKPIVALRTSTHAFQ